MLQLINIAGGETIKFSLSGMASLTLKQKYLNSDQKLGLPNYGYNIAIGQMIYSYYMSIVAPQIPNAIKAIHRFRTTEETFNHVMDELDVDARTGNLRQTAKDDEYKDTPYSLRKTSTIEFIEYNHET